MGVGERMRGPVAALILLLLGAAGLWAPWALGLMRPASPPAPQAWALCSTPDDCRPVDVTNLKLDAQVVTLRTTFIGPRSEADGPLAVHVTAMASSEVFWNGEPIGRNGAVGRDAVEETPGRYSAVIVVPPDRIRPGPNQVEVRLSAHHLWAPVPRPVHWLSIGSYQDPLRPTLLHYLPTLLMIGLLALAFLAFALAWLSGRRRDSLVFAALSGVVLLQAAIEAAKLVLVYAYPWQLARLAGIAVLSALAGLLVLATVLRFVRSRPARLALVAAALVAVAVALTASPWWDAKALWAFHAGLTVALVAAALGVRRGEPGAATAGIALVAGLALSWTPGFLDVGYFLMFVTLFGWRLWRAVREMQTARAAADGRALAAEARAARDAEGVVLIPNGGTRHRVAARDIVSVRADDDYSQIRLADGRELLATVNLAGLLRLLPPGFERIHRSHAVNRARIASLHRSGRTGRAVQMDDGAILPVGRTYRAILDEPEL